MVLSRQLEIDTATTQQEPVPFLLFLSVFTLFIGISGIALLTERHNGSIITVKEENRIDLSKFNHSSSDDDMDTLCVLSRALDRSIRACALGALATAASNNVMGDHIANSEDLS